MSDVEKKKFERLDPTLPRHGQVVRSTHVSSIVCQLHIHCAVSIMDQSWTYRGVGT